MSQASQTSAANSTSSRQPRMPRRLRRILIRWRFYLALPLLLTLYIIWVLCRSISLVVMHGPTALSITSNLLDIFLLYTFWQHISWLLMVSVLGGVVVTAGIGFEWLARQEQRKEAFYGCTVRYQLASPKGRIRQLSWSPDGQWLASTEKPENVWGYWDDQDYSYTNPAIYLWNAQTGSLHRTLPDTSNRGKLSWSPNGKWLASGSVEGIIWVRDVDTGNLCSRLESHPACIDLFTWSPDGSTLTFLIRNGQKICLWDVEKRTILYELPVPVGDVTHLAWSPDGKIVAFSTSHNDFIYLWSTTNEKERIPLSDRGAITHLSWSPNGNILAYGSSSLKSNINIGVWNIKTKSLIHEYRNHDYLIDTFIWSSDGHWLAVSSFLAVDFNNVRKANIYLLNCQTSKVYNFSSDQHGLKPCIAWSPDGRILTFPGSSNANIQLFDTHTERIRSLDGQTGPVVSLAFVDEGRLLISFCLSADTPVSIWRVDTTERVSIFNRRSPSESFVFTSWSALSIHPKLSMFAVTGLMAVEAQDSTALVWEFDPDILLDRPISRDTVHYANAKVVLVGDSGVGKSGLSLVLTGQQYKETDSTHARHVWTLSRHEVTLQKRQKETHEILLWDLAGQPGYRIIHQLYLDEVVIALVVFNGHSETDPFAGVRYWDRALRQARSLQGGTSIPLKKFLVAARTDRSGIGVSRDRIEALCQELGFDDYFLTSAKEGTQITQLKQKTQEGIPWNKLPTVSSPRLFRDMKAFLVDVKKSGRLMSTGDHLYDLFYQIRHKYQRLKDLQEQFETCIGRVESAGLIKRLSFGKLVLLQPELLDAYASALVNAVRNEPDGLGSIEEDKVRAGNFHIPVDERLKDKEQEKLLLIAMVEDLSRRELVLREDSMLVFPAQSTREYPNLPEPKRKYMIFEFEGPVLNIYATLAVRLAHSGSFQLKNLWKNAVTYTASVGEVCGLFLRQVDEGRGELSLFFEARVSARARPKTQVSEETLHHFTEFVQVHLQRKVLRKSLKQRLIFICNSCDTMIPEEMVQKRRKLGHTSLSCPVCERPVSLAQQAQANIVPSVPVLEMERMADQQREREAARSIVQGKKATNDFDVFLCHHGVDKPGVKEIGKQLMERGILPWLDEWELRPGLPWQRLLEAQIGSIKSAAVFVGESGMGPWQQMEMEAFLREFVSRGCPVIPVLLPNAPDKPQLPIFLRGMTWVDFRPHDPPQNPGPLERLIWGITGKNDGYDML